jgi:lipoate-protein ligase A
VNVALDEVLQQPTLRFWKWNHSAVILGRSQSISNEIDLEAVREMNLQIVRRITGGGAMFIEPEGAITYSMILPEAATAGLTIRQSYEICDAWVIRGLRELEIEVHHVPINDLACSRGKIGGAAQARRNGIVVHHTTLAYSMNSTAMLRVLRIGRESLSQRGVRSAAKVVAPLNQQTHLPRQAIVDHLLWTFQQLFGGEVRALEADELAAGEELAAGKYATDLWTHEVE